MNAVSPDRLASSVAGRFTGHPFLQAVVQYIAGATTGIYLVGGTARDLMADRPPQGDLDFAVAGDSGLRVARRVANHFGGAYYPLDPARDTGRAILSHHAGRLVLDFAGIRGPDIYADLRDRDFTVNALALDLHSGQLLDPTGGLNDLRAGRLHAISGQVFQNDPARLLRAPRQATEIALTIDVETRDLILRDAPRMNDVSRERIRDEICRLLTLPNGAAALPELDTLRLLTQVWPELSPLKGVTQPAPHHFDVFEHTLQAVNALEGLLLLPPHGLADKAAQAYLAQPLSADRPRALLLKLAALLHDAGKPESRSVGEDGRIHFYRHEVAGAKRVEQALQRLHFATNEVRWVQTVVRHHLRPLQMARQQAGRRATYRFYRDTGDAGPAIALLSLADVQATWSHDLPADAWQRHLHIAERLYTAYFQEREDVVLPPPLIDGRDVMAQLGLSPGPEIGRLLEAVREAQAAGEISTREDALALLHESATNHTNFVSSQ